MAVQVTTLETATRLKYLRLAGYSNWSGSGNDQITICDTNVGTCWSFANSETVLNLNQGWTETEFNVLGFSGGAMATFNSGVTVKVSDYEATWRGGLIVPSCDFHKPAFSGELNDLTFGTCSVQANTWVVFTETH
jgi:hypothetical protein